VSHVCRAAAKSASRRQLPDANTISQSLLRCIVHPSPTYGALTAGPVMVIIRGAVPARIMR